MTSLDEQIRAVLTKEEAQELENLSSEQGLFDKIGETFRSKMRFWIILLWMKMLALVPIIAWTGWNFFQATEARQMVLWGAITTILILVLLIMKIWYWMEINQNTVTREVKRLELQIAYLAKSIAKN